ncbi:MAG TPA: hypothetical protein VHP33_33550 [Polyangiaceae bacterium]|nr:hypothetical protein [Polyangiaceae bacterium]
MREVGLPPVLKWRWAPCAALVLGSLSFVGFALLAIPDHIGQMAASSTTSSLQLGNQFARTQTPAPATDWSGDTTNTASASPSLRERAATRTGDVPAFPKRGFSPPLERPEPPAAPVPPPPAAPVQPQLNVPPPVPALPAPPPPAPAQAEPPTEATPVPPPPDAPAPQPAAVQ